MTLGWRHGSVVKRTCRSSEGLEFVPSTHVGQLTTSCNSSSRGLMTSSGFYRHLHSQAHTHRQTDTTQTDRRHTIKNKANLQNMLLNYTLNFFQRKFLHTFCHNEKGSHSKCAHLPATRQTMVNPKATHGEKQS